MGGLRDLQAGKALPGMDVLREGALALRVESFPSMREELHLLPGDYYWVTPTPETHSGLTSNNLEAPENTPNALTTPVRIVWVRDTAMRE